MYQNQTIGAFSQRLNNLNKKVARLESPAGDDDTFQNANLRRVTVDYDQSMGEVASENGVVKGPFNVKKGDSVKLTAKAFDGFKFIEWDLVKNVTKRTSPTIDFTVEHDVTLKVVFAKEDNPGGGGVGDSGDDNNVLASALKKYWWVIAVVLCYLILKEGEK